MSTAAKLSVALASFALAGAALAGCTAAPEPPAADATATPSASAAPSPSPSPTYLTELPAYALENAPWIIYPDGLECTGTEGCPNDYRQTFGEPGPVLPEGVEYFNPLIHHYVNVAPAD